MSIGFTEILLILVIILLLFGSKRIPELAKALGKAGFEFKRAKDTLKKEFENSAKETEKSSDTEN